MVARYHVNEVDGRKFVGEIVDVLDRLARDGARQMLERALAAEVDEFLGRERYARGPEFHGYRNGYNRPRTVGIGTWAVPVKAPRVSDVPEVMPAFQSRILPKRKRLSMETQKLFCQLYLEGLSSSGVRSRNPGFKVTRLGHIRGSVHPAILPLDSAHRQRRHRGLAARSGWRWSSSR